MNSYGQRMKGTIAMGDSLMHTLDQAPSQTRHSKLMAETLPLRYPHHTHKHTDIHTHTYTLVFLNRNKSSLRQVNMYDQFASNDGTTNEISKYRTSTPSNALLQRIQRLWIKLQKSYNATK